LRDNTNAYVLIITDNDVDKINCTFESLLTQKFDMERLRIAVIDNASIDGTYKKLLEYEIKYPNIISVIRVKQATTRGRLLKKLVTHLRFSNVSYSIIMNPGDILYRDFMSIATTHLRLTGVSFVAFEADLNINQKKMRQTPMFKNNCILNALCMSEYFKTDLEHELLILCRGLPCWSTTKLVDMVYLSEPNSWYAYLMRMRFVSWMYIKESQGCVFKEDLCDIQYDMINKMFQIKRLFFNIETNTFSTLQVNDKEFALANDAYHWMAMYALRLAANQIIKNNYEEAESCITFAEMTYLDIVEEDLFCAVEKAIRLKKHSPRVLNSIIKYKSLDPPRESHVF
jgi:glycosyltransferase involved in cell wall biosynthesis